MDRFLTWNNPVLRKGEGVLECSWLHKKYVGRENKEEGK